jgi:hypothetical protein|tara:strand:- start:110 stop:646 length:537 start_codon:yes stop_codon:yes gene_type:complete
MSEIRTVMATITGISALLMHRFPTEPVNKIEMLTKEEQAEIAAYRDANEELYVPGVAFTRALVAGATYSKGKGRASLQKPVAACVIVTPENLLIGAKEYDIDSRRVVNPSTKGAIIRHRPRIEAWSFDVEIEYDPTLVTEAQLRTVVDDTGLRVGLLDYRPATKGSFGRFRVDNWESA